MPKRLVREVYGLIFFVPVLLLLIVPNALLSTFTETGFLCDCELYSIESIFDNNLILF